MFEGGLPGPAWEQFLAHHLEDRAHASNLIYLAFIASKKGSSYGPSYDKFGMCTQSMIFIGLKQDFVSWSLANKAIRKAAP